VQKFLRVIFADQKEVDEHSDDPAVVRLFPFSDRQMENCFILQLLNVFITEFDYAQVNSSRSMEAMAFRHLVLNCPNIKKVTVTPRVWKKYEFLPRVCNNDLFLLMAKWKQFTSVQMRSKLFKKIFPKSGMSLLK